VSSWPAPGGAGGGGPPPRPRAGGGGAGRPGGPPPAAVEAPPLRGQVLEIGGLRLLMDCYNANPQSVRAALTLLTDLSAKGEKVAFLGSMLELGDRSPELHLEVLAEARDLPLRAVVAVGEFHRAAEELDWTGAAPLLLAAASAEEGYERLAPHLTGTETVLLKGSRGMALERLAERFEADFGGGTTSPEEG
jgi:UDP-N-acetylmuramyl pentapeptide synthase